MDPYLMSDVERDFLPLDDEFEDEADRTGGVMGSGTPASSGVARSSAAISSKPKTAMEQWKEHVGTMPQRSDAKPKWYQRLGAAAAGGAAGYLNVSRRANFDPAAIGDNIQYAGYNRKMRDWQQKEGQLKTTAGIESAQTNAELRAKEAEARIASEEAQREHYKALDARANQPRFVIRNGKAYSTETGLPVQTETERIAEEVAARRAAVSGPNQHLSVGLPGTTAEFDLPGAPPDESDPRVQEYIMTGKMSAPPREQAPPRPVSVPPGNTLIDPTTGKALYTNPKRDGSADAEARAEARDARRETQTNKKTQRDADAVFERAITEAENDFADAKRKLDLYFSGKKDPKTGEKHPGREDPQYEEQLTAIEDKLHKAKTSAGRAKEDAYRNSGADVTPITFEHPSKARRAAASAGKPAPVGQIPGAKKTLDANTARSYLQKAGGNKDIARQMAAKDGYSF